MSSFPKGNPSFPPDRSNNNRNPDRLIRADEQLQKWLAEAEFEEEVRCMMRLLRPHRKERLSGWHEHRTRGQGFRVTIAWDPSLDPEGETSPFAIPQLTDMLENILVGSVRNQDEIDPKEEFELYANVVRELGERLKELRSRYEL